MASCSWNAPISEPKRKCSLWSHKEQVLTNAGLDHREETQESGPGRWPALPALELASRLGQMQKQQSGHFQQSLLLYLNSAVFSLFAGKKKNPQINGANFTHFMHLSMYVLVCRVHRSKIALSTCKQSCQGLKSTPWVPLVSYSFRDNKLALKQIRENHKFSLSVA